MDLGQLAILPATNTKQVTHHIALLLAIQLRHVFVRAHDEVFDEPEMKRVLVLDKDKFSRICVESLEIRTVFSHHVKQAKLTFVCVVHGFIIIEKILGKNESLKVLEFDIQLDLRSKYYDKRKSGFIKISLRNVENC